MERYYFHWADYVTCILSVLCTIAIGVYHGFFQKAQVTTRGFLLADRNMHVLPVALSLLLSYFSAIAFLGNPVEVYYYGGLYFFTGVGYMLGILPIYFYFAAKFHSLNITSCFEVSHLLALTKLNYFCLTLSSLNSPLLSSPTTSRELLSQFSAYSG